MKRILLGLTMLLTVTAFSGQAFAYFEEGKLMLSVYNETDMDLGIDLGNALALSQTTDTNVILAQAGTVTLDKFGDNVNSWSDLSAASWGAIAASMQLYMGVTETVSPVPTLSQYSNFTSCNNLVRSEYNSVAAGDQYAVILSSNRQSYDMRMNSGSTSPGTIGGLNGAGSIASEVNLGTLDTLGYADLNLYAYDYMNNQSSFAGGNAPNAVIRIMADGSVLLNASATPEVPLPGTLILLSSGLLGMIGIRRKKA